ncbi:MAG: pyruvate dehydrogenase (acetyl-transferring) E1 component subunit alpha [Firmicutes bacterium]|nr:pyruvate dehydrogenase (acetyl-transferring) E1 component subunit alpha [Bacillota bacterium]
MIRVDVSRRQILAPDGKLVGEMPALGPDTLRDMYRIMVLARTFDQRALNLQRQGRIGTFAPAAGQEASQVGAVFAMRRDEWLFPTYRSHPAMLAHGMPLDRLFLYPMAHPLGGVAPPGVAIYSVAISIAAHLPHAAGAAWASRIRRESKGFVALFGDGATSEGDFHEAMNFAGVFRAPLVFLCENNGWAISVPREHQTASETIAQKAVAYGFGGEVVDGNDVLAVYQATSEALERARAGEGPTLIEAQTYRLGPHTTADDPTRYRKPEELTEAERIDPILRLRLFLEGRDLWSEKEEAALRAEAQESVRAAYQKAQETPPMALGDLVPYVYAEVPPYLAAEREEMNGWRV